MMGFVRIGWVVHDNPKAVVRMVFINRISVTPDPGFGALLLVGFRVRSFSFCNFEARVSFYWSTRFIKLSDGFILLRHHFILLNWRSHFILLANISNYFRDSNKPTDTHTIQWYSHDIVAAALIYMIIPHLNSRMKHWCELQNVLFAAFENLRQVFDHPVFENIWNILEIFGTKK